VGEKRISDAAIDTVNLHCAGKHETSDKEKDHLVAKG
jgi:hypothetical protein